MDLTYKETHLLVLGSNKYYQLYLEIFELRTNLKGSILIDNYYPCILKSYKFDMDRFLVTIGNKIIELNY